MSKLKRALSLVLALVLAGGMTVLYSCNGTTDESSGGAESSLAPTQSREESSEVPMVPDENAALIWSDEYADETNGIGSPDDVFLAEYYFDGALTDDYAKAPADGDAKYVFSGKDATRIVNHAYGYSLTFPYTGVTLDNTLSEYRTKYTSDKSVLTVSYENKNPYGNTENGWNIYFTEWLDIHVGSLDFLGANQIRRNRPAVVQSTEVLEGYSVTVYYLYLNMADGVEMPFYNIAYIRPVDSYTQFYLLVMKSTEECNDNFDKIIASFREIERQGSAKNHESAYELVIPDYWSEETRAYYEMFRNSDKVSWGAFTKTIVSKEDSSYSTRRDEIIANLDRLQGEDGLDYNLDILPTYSALGWYGTPSYFPLDMANEFAGGNGVNGKPVLQFTYQFTDSNNWNLGGYNPSFDILRGKYDDQFRRLAQDIKAYGKPVLFRLNNEMNTDWTSYSGICALLDPDIFRMTWERLYNIFLEEGVDNCIWIFNPIAVSCPYSNWGEALNYFPGTDMVQALGLTYYEMGNSLPMRTFRDMYTELYEKNMPYFDNFPWIISEFAAGAGGEKLYDYSLGMYKDTALGRNETYQANWVKDMFECFSHYGEEGYEFITHIKGAVWFSCNDYADIDGTSYITNYLDLAPTLTKTLEQMRAGLAEYGANTRPKE